ncbi:TonB-dependent receptor [Rufibacter latericius]|uniref:TonB-dependent receptor n=1 Tax=Rufibacter latericius TaxID=2487040 RepID=A0A3M9MZT6_9BACT|nr:TonB-dependent receptor [Rufibacter latericius]RNI31071.1 TonB-dependent receptor [Rufibacter latericius]
MRSKVLFSLILLFVFTISLGHSQQVSSLRGKVQDRNAAGIPGANVRLLNTNQSAVTDAQGQFLFNNVPSGNYRMQVSAVGFATSTQTVRLPQNETDIIFQLTESAARLDEVVVSSQKVEEDLQRVPASITALTSKQVQEYRLWNTRDISTIIPNLYSSDPGDNRNLTSIRGIATTSYDPAVATYIDGVNQFTLDTYLPELLDVERIEVLRGPQGTLYGRNAMGGVINIITRQPSNTPGGFASLDFGNYGQQRYSLGFRAPLVQDKLFLGVSGMFRKQDGFYTNTYDNSDFDRQRVFAGNYYLKYLVNPSWSLTLNAKHSQNRNHGAFPLASSLEEALAHPFEVNQNAVGKMIDNTFNGSFIVNHTGSGFNFTSQTAYQSNYRVYDQPLDGDFSPIDGVSIVNDYGNERKNLKFFNQEIKFLGGEWNKVKVLTQEIRFSSPASSISKLQWVAGAYGFFHDNPVKQGTHFGKDAEMMGAPFPFFTSININEGQNYGTAFFGQGTYRVLPNLEFTAGLRYDYEHRKQTIRGEFQPDGDELMVVRSDTSSKASFKAFSPKASLAYHLTDDVHLYGSYSRGFRTGGITQLSSDPSQPPLFAYDPEYSNNYEIGLKTAFLQNRVTANVSAFYTQVTDAQVPTLVLPEALIITRNVGELESKGVELELNATPLKGLETSYSFGYTDAKYTRLTGTNDGEEVNLNGNKQIFTPNITSMLALQYGHSLGNSQNLRLVLRGEWRYLGKQYFDLANQLSQDGFSVFNARAGVQTKRFEAFLWGRNLTDETYIDYAYNFGATRLGNPATYGVSLRANF